MENGNFLESLASKLGQSASVKNVYGDPVQAGDKTIIPVAQIAYGFGGGYGQGGKRRKATQQGEMTSQQEGPQGEGSGGGGGVTAKLKGVFEISAAGTRFIPADNTRQLLIGLLIGFVLRSWLSSRHRNKVR